MEKIKVSVIVPIYNTEKFLRKCIESILNQTLEEMEIILINDGSTDNSHVICEEYGKKFPQKIRYINNKNIGCSATRNLGISLAKGEYIAFVDSDDYIDQEMYQEMYEKAKNEGLDIAICGITYIDLEAQVSNKIIPNNINNKNDYLCHKNRMANPVNKLFKKNIIKDLTFPQNTHAGEDIVFCYKSILNSKKISHIEKSYYNYIYHGNNSIFNLEKRLGIFIAFKELYKYLVEKNYTKDKNIMKIFYENFNFYAIRAVFFMLLNSKLVSKKEYKKYNKLFYKELKKINFIPLKSKILIYYYKNIVWIIRKFNLYIIIKKIKPFFKRKEYLKCHI